MSAAALISGRLHAALRALFESLASSFSSAGDIWGRRPLFPDRALAAARKEGATGERARIKSILESDAAKGKGKLAYYLAFGTDMSGDAATAILEMGASDAAAAEAHGAAQAECARAPTVH